MFKKRLSVFYVRTVSQFQCENWSKNLVPDDDDDDDDDGGI